MSDFVLINSYNNNNCAHILWLYVHHILLSRLDVFTAPLFLKNILFHQPICMENFKISHFYIYPNKIVCIDRYLYL